MKATRVPVLNPDGVTASVPLTRGLVAIIDAIDVPLVEDRNWHAVPGKYSFYARDRNVVRMHQIIAGVGCDHINRDGLDNRRANLRPATPFQQNGNKRLQKNNTSGARGVWRNGQQWSAQIRIDKTPYYLGVYYTRREAQEVYDAAARKAFGEFYVPGPLTPVEPLPHGKCEWCGIQLGPPMPQHARYCTNACGQRARRAKARQEAA